MTKTPKQIKTWKLSIFVGAFFLFCSLLSDTFPFQIERNYSYDECHYWQSLRHFDQHFINHSFHSYYLQKSLCFIAVGGAIKILQAGQVLDQVTDDTLRNGMHLLNALLMAFGSAAFLSLMKREQSPFPPLFLLFLLYWNFGFLKFLPYFPVLSDIAAFTLSLLLMKSWWERTPYQIFFWALLSAFINPLLCYSVFFLCLFPRPPIELSPSTTPWHLRMFFWLPLTLGVSGFVLYGFESNVYEYMHRWRWPIFFPDQLNLGVSLIVLHGSLYALLHILPIRSINELFRIAASSYSLLRGGVYLLGFLAASFLVHRFSAYPDFSLWVWDGEWGFIKGLSSTWLHSISKPGAYFVGHATFFGSLFLLICLEWKRVTHFIASQGLGFSLFLFSQIFLTGFDGESRHALAAWPWIAFAWVKSTSLANRSLREYLWPLVIVQVFLSSIWLVFLEIDSSLSPDAYWILHSLGAGLTPLSYIFAGIAVGLAMYRLKQLLRNDRQNIAYDMPQSTK